MEFPILFFNLILFYFSFLWLLSLLVSKVIVRGSGG